MEYTLLIIFQVFYGSYCSLLSGFNLYHTDNLVNDLDRDCLYYRIPDTNMSYQVAEYCIRYSPDEKVLYPNDHHSLFTFEDLRQLNVTSYDLFKWLAPIDLIENYQNYLENKNTSMSTFPFYNCTYPWFGSRCEYRFSQVEFNFAKQIESMLAEKLVASLQSISQNFSCYTYLPCDRTGDQHQTSKICLGWREICDGKIDCINGGYDEEQCWQLEMNECDYKTEFRCQIGLCIPLSFFDDDKFTPDCLDRSDEPHEVDSKFDLIAPLNLKYVCHGNPNFRCEEQTCYTASRKPYQIDCGDGTCQPLFGSCLSNRNRILVNVSIVGANISENCYLAIRCLSGLVQYINTSDTSCQSHLFTLYVNDIKQFCPRVIKFLPIMFGHVQFVYVNNRSWDMNLSLANTLFNPPDYICYNAKLCDDDDRFFSVSNSFVDIFNDNSTCRPVNEFKLSAPQKNSWFYFTEALYVRFRKCRSYAEPESMLNYSNLYTCVNSSKLISQHRLVDMVEDCLYGDDESYTESCSLNHFNHRFKCNKNTKTICLARIRVEDAHKDCIEPDDELREDEKDSSTVISFPKICDGYTSLSPILIDGYNETDETDCTHFPCNNTYTRCNSFWNCPDGIDEVNCEWPTMCPFMHHLCLSPITGNFACLPIERVNDGIMDCLGATDERNFCRQSSKPYRCWNSDICISSTEACQDNLCPHTTNVSMNFCKDVSVYISFFCILYGGRTFSEWFLCRLFLDDTTHSTYLSFNILSHWPTLSSSIRQQSIALKLPASNTVNIINSNPLQNNEQTPWDCLQGLVIYRSLGDINNYQSVCLCPPAYYGRQCEYQNQRVSLTVQIQLASDWTFVFIVIVTLRRDDQQGPIESYNNFNYLPFVDCQKKFNLYLLYTTRPKNNLTNYFVRIDLYNKHTFKFRASWSFPVRFPFLPVYRLAVQLNESMTKTITLDCENLKCGVHGHCRKFSNTNMFFCLCDEGWSGLLCTIQHACHCSSDAYCLDSNICLCPLEKFGPRCYLRYPTCACKNGGSCVQNDDFMIYEDEFRCACLEGYSGLRCEIADTKIVISFASDVSIPPYIHVHFIEVRGTRSPHIQTTSYKKIPLDQDTVTTYKLNVFHIVFVETDKPKTYYLTIFQLVHIPSITIPSILTRSKQCLSISELFNATFVQMHLIRRIKYYHVPCKKHPNLACFYDDSHMCICTDNPRQANCFTFNHTTTSNCKVQNICENNGECFQDHPTCPLRVICRCDDCSYGSRCQFSTKGFALSLDIILGYQVRSNISFAQQRSVIKVTVAIVTLMIIFGLINGILSMMTFSRKKIREIASGYYLLVSTCVSILITIIFTLKFFMLIAIQISFITNRNYLAFNCKSIDFLLKSLFNINGWLNASVGIERAQLAKNEKNVNQVTRKRFAKWIIIGICLLTIASHVQVPIYSNLIDDNEEERTWCTTEFPSFIRIFDSTISIIHFLLPFILNISTALIIIINAARHRSAAQKQQPYKEHLRQQFSRLKHLLISPVVFIVLALPELIISFISGCMKSPRNPWIYLFANLMSYVPSMLTFIVFVLPSETYVKEFKEAVKHMQRYIHRR